MKLAILAAAGVAAAMMLSTTAEAQVRRQLQFFNKCPLPAPLLHRDTT
ncbi:hypothetical protein [Sphingomonas sp. M1-B02]|nr:hypothetical protein [Sphingomonas sp. S6-11]UZK65884.1 hypothetical protein OKW87_15445 [Sphingomonas sp. S6-11]